MELERFEQDFVDAAVAFHQYKDYLGIDEVGALSHDDTKHEFERAMQLAGETNIAASYRAVAEANATDEQQEHIRVIESTIASGLFDSEIITEKAMNKRVRALGKLTTLESTARQFIVLSPSVEDLPEEEHTPEDFILLLTTLMDTYYGDEGEEEVISKLEDFAVQADVEFLEPATPEEAMLKRAAKVEQEVSNFIQSNERLSTFDLLNKTELEQLFEIYNPNNLLFLAKELSMQSGNLGLDQAKVDRLYRYKNIINRIKTAIHFEQLTEERQQQSSAKTVDGHRTWGGDIHAYGVETGGIIDVKEYKDFSNDDEVEQSPPEIVIGGERIRLRQNNQIIREAGYYEKD